MKRAALGVALVSGCGPLPLTPFELDVSSNCNAVVVDTLREDLDARGGTNWTRVLAAAADAPASDGVWLLVVAEREGGESGLAVVHVSSEDIVVVDELPTAVADAEDLELVPGPDRGQMWLVERASAVFRIRRYGIEPDPLLLAASGNFGAPGGFPSLVCMDEDGNIGPCDIADWMRELVFFDSSPYLLSVPPASGDASVDVVVGPLDGSLSFVTSQQILSFSPDCDPNLPADDLLYCEEWKAAMYHPKLAPIGVQSDTRPPTTSFALYRETSTRSDGFSDRPQSDVAFVVLGHNASGDPVGNLVSEPTLLAPESEEQGGVAVDSRAMYVKYDAGVSPTIVQKAMLDNGFTILTADLAVDDDSELLQLDEDVALGRIVDGEWEIVKLFPDAPGESRVTMHDPGSPLERVDSAGPGTFLLHEAEGGPDLVHLRCSDEPRAS